MSIPNAATLPVDPSFLDRSRTVAVPGYNRWLVLPAALAIYLSIGQVYSFSIFSRPLLAVSGAVGAHWSQKQIGLIYTLVFVMFGVSAALLGQWIDSVGPRRAMALSASCFGLGFFIATAGIALHQIALVYLGYSFVCGIGLGVGYVCSVTTLIKWFPDRPGFATGLAIMGFEGGAIIGSPLSIHILKYYGGTISHAIVRTWPTLGCLYFLFMLFSVFTIRVPRAGWMPPGWNRKGLAAPSKLVSAHDVTVSDSMRTPQFFLLWLMVFASNSAGLGFFRQASSIIQTLLVGHASASKAAGAVIVLSLFSLFSRLAWPSLSDLIGRRTAYTILFTLGIVLYFTLPFVHSLALFVVISGLMLSLYGGGFAMLPAYIKDLFGSVNVTAIHGRLLTALSAAFVLSPLSVDAIIDHANAAGDPLQLSYKIVLRALSAVMVVGLVANFFIRPVAARYWVPANEIVDVELLAMQENPTTNDREVKQLRNIRTNIAVRWMVVVLPVVWGVYISIQSAIRLFTK